MTYMVIAKVNEIDYLTSVDSETAYGAEHKVLDLSICGKHTYGVTNCMAYDVEDMKYDTFRYNAITAKPVSFEALSEIIEERNAEIREKDEAEERIRQIEQQMKYLTEEMSKAKAILAR